MEKNLENLYQVIDHIKKHGPTRVVYNDQGAAMSPERVKLMTKISPEVVFVRDDLWSLGAPGHLEEIAKGIWENQWIAKIDLGTGEVTIFDDK